MEPVAGKTGHCFVVGERHQLRALHVGLARLCRAGSPKAVVPPQTTGKNFSRLSSKPTTSTFFLLGRISTLAWARRHSDAGQVRRNCRVRRQFRTKKFLVPPQTGRNAIEGKYPSIQLPVLPVHMTRRAGVYLSEKVVCQTYHPPNHAWASQLGEPVLGEPVLIGRAIKRGWGEPSNEVGASHQTRLGEPVLSRWASQY